MASARPSRVSKTTAMLLNKVATGTLDEFLGEAPVMNEWPLDVAPVFSGAPYEQAEVAVKRERPEPQDDDDDELEEYGGTSVVRVAVAEEDDEDGEEAVVHRIKKPIKAAKKRVKKAKKSAVRKETVFSVPTRQLPLRKSVEKRDLGSGIAMGDYVADNRMEELVDRLVAATHDREVRREGADPDPTSRRIWDSDCHVLGRGLIVARSRLPDAGFGLFATQMFEKGVLVTEYVGEELTKEQAFALRAAGMDQYVRSLKNGYCIDGNKHPALGDSCAQMANDGRNLLPNNCIFVAIHNRDKVQEKPRVYLKTLQQIEPGEELLASYGKRYWEFHGKSNSSESMSSASGESSNAEDR